MALPERIREQIQDGQNLANKLMEQVKAAHLSATALITFRDEFMQQLREYYNEQKLFRP